MTVTFTPNKTGVPAGKLADAALHFDAAPLAGLRLDGFGVWQRRSGERNITFPAKQYSVNGERRSIALVRPDPQTPDAHHNLRDWILAAYAEFERQE